MYLTYDIGTSALKTALIGEDGSVVAISVREYSPISPKPGLVEMPVQVYWESLVNGTRSVIAEGRASAEKISGIGISSQGQTFIPVDRNGKALSNAIVWLDNRAQGIADQWAREWLSEETFRRSSGYPRMPAGLTVFKIAWLADHLPRAHKAWKFLCLPDYLIYRLCGETATNPLSAQMTGLWDIRTEKWSPRLLAAARIEEDRLPTVVESGTVVGTTLASAASEIGIPPGTPICTGTNDQIAGALGAGNVRPGIITETTGTALAVVATVHDLWESEELLVGRHAAPGRYFALAYAATSAVVLKWFRDTAGSEEGYENLIREASAIGPGSDGLTVLPHFAGTGTPTFNPNARGAIVGLGLGHTRAHITRAIMESCACLLRECLEPIRRRIGVTTIRSLGGAARSDLWLQMKADMLGIPIEKPRCPEAANLGAAMLAAAGTGRFKTVVEAADAWYRPSSVFEPNEANQSSCEDVYSRYRSLYERLYSNQPNGE